LTLQTVALAALVALTLRKRCWGWATTPSAICTLIKLVTELSASSRLKLLV